MYRTLCIALAFSGCASYQGIMVTGQVPLLPWSGLHPQASHDLGVWADRNKAEAAWLFSWMGEHPDRAKTLLRWALAGSDSVQAFAEGHPQFDGLEGYAPAHAPPLDDFLAWCRRFAPESTALVDHSKALPWTGTHLDVAIWHLEHPGD